ATPQSRCCTRPALTCDSVRQKDGSYHLNRFVLADHSAFQVLDAAVTPAYKTTTGWYKFGSTASPIATSSPVRVTAFTYFDAGCDRNGDAGKLRPLRTCRTVTSSTNTLGTPGSSFDAGTMASISRSSAASRSNCSIVRA